MNNEGVNSVVNSFTKFYPIQEMNVILSNYGKGHYTYLETNAFIREIFKSTEEMDK